MSPHILMNRYKVRDFCRKWEITELSLFKTILSDDARLGGHVGVLASFAPGGQWDLLDHMDMEEELSTILGCRVTLLTRRSVERSENRIWRESVLSGSEALYVMR